MANTVAALNAATRDFSLPHRDSADRKLIEYPVTIDRSVTERPWRVPEPLPEGLETGDSSRKDAGKDAGFWLIPYVGLRELARTYKIGADKYQPRGWEKGMAWSRVVDPMFRHLFKWLGGEKYDQVDGQHHLAAVAWACFALMEFEETHPELDDVHATPASA